MTSRLGLCTRNSTSCRCTYTVSVRHYPLCLSPTADNLCLLASCLLSYPFSLPSRQGCSVRMLVHTLSSALRAFLGVLLLSKTSGAFQVSPDSPCSSLCTIDGAADSNSTEIVCSDADISATPTGLRFRRCVECLQTSPYFSGTDSDVKWFLCKPNLIFAEGV